MTIFIDIYKGKNRERSLIPFNLLVEEDQSIAQKHRPALVGVCSESGLLREDELSKNGFTYWRWWIRKADSRWCPYGNKFFLVDGRYPT